MKTKLLLHVCCAPCSIAVIDELKSSHDLTVLFFNPNIQPFDEYEKRKGEVVRVCAEWGVPMVDQDRQAEVWEAEVAGIVQEREGGPRCQACYRLRFLRTAVYAREHDFEMFASSLASGRQKDSRVVNAVGEAVSREVGVPFLAEDWKKGGRTEKSRAMVAERGIYRQKYCGCLFSLADAEERQRPRG